MTEIQQPTATSPVGIHTCGEECSGDDHVGRLFLRADKATVHNARNTVERMANGTSITGVIPWPLKKTNELSLEERNDDAYIPYEVKWRVTGKREPSFQNEPSTKTGV